VLGLDRVGDGFELVGVAGDEDEVEAFLGELKGEGFADAVGGAGDDGPGSVAAEVLAGAEEVDVEGCEEGEGEPEDGDGAEGEEDEEPCGLGFEVSADLHEMGWRMRRQS